MTIRLHIDRLVLDGISLDAHQTPALRAAVERELGRMLIEGGLGRSFQSGGVLRNLPGGNIQLQDPVRPDHLGGQIARAVYEGIGKK